ncbi:MAG TPA: SUMF1/EgtB/PvdO family nonheme iron enzyme [Pyrinomonadaceae bacterium]
MPPAPPRTTSRLKAPAAPPSRLVPLSVAGVVCFLVALILGCTAWYFFGTHRRQAAADKQALVQTPRPETAATPEATPAPPVKRAPAGEVPVTAGEVALGGEGTDMPLRRELVSPFHVAETEVTNAQYREFVRATRHKAPPHWKGDDFPPGTAAEPVTNVTWQDAVDYCEWLSKEIGARVRLPTEAEWERAARGDENFKYPWGNEFNERAVVSAETQGRIRAVKSFDENRSPFGAYDMAGNVWEWVSDEARDESGQPILLHGLRQRVIKGGAAVEPRKFMTAQTHYQFPEEQGSEKLGFRYVVERENETKPNANR